MEHLPDYLDSITYRNHIMKSAYGKQEITN